MSLRRIIDKYVSIAQIIDFIATLILNSNISRKKQLHVAISF